MINSCKYEDLLLDSNDDMNELIAKSYASFCDCMNSEELSFMNQKILYKKEKDLQYMKEFGYLHIASMENEMKIRIFDKSRMMYIPLIKNILADCSKKSCSNIAVYRDNKDICIWCRKNKYLIVLSPREKGYLLNTAYPVIYDRKIYTIEKKANENGL